MRDASPMSRRRCRVRQYAGLHPEALTHGSGMPPEGETERFLSRSLANCLRKRAPKRTGAAD